MALSILWNWDNSVIKYKLITEYKEMFSKPVKNL